MLNNDIIVPNKLTMESVIKSLNDLAINQRLDDDVVGCSLEHKQLAIWLSALKAITENNYSTKSN